MTFFNRKKGATVAEMIVVIAVLSIISTIVVSFMVVANEKVRTSNEKVNALSDIAVIESMVNRWVKEKIDDDYDLSTVHGGNHMNLRATKDVDGVTEKIILTFSNGKLYSGEEVLYSSSVISKLSFFVSVSENVPSNKNCLVICQVTYKIHKSRREALAYEYAFAVANYESLITEGIQ